MARIPEKSKRYRTKDDLVRDVAYILNAPLTHGTKYAVLDNAAWTWTEFHGKTEGCPYWTPAALTMKANNRLLRHEHAVPKAVVIDMLLNLKSATEEQVHDVCESFLIGVVVTTAEDSVLCKQFRKTMPPEFFDPKSPEHHDPWLRYKRCGIRVTCQRPDLHFGQFVRKSITPPSADEALPRPAEPGGHAPRRG